MNGSPAFARPAETKAAIIRFIVAGVRHQPMDGLTCPRAAASTSGAHGETA